MSPMLSHAIERLFARLTAVYGAEFTGRFAGMEPEAVKKAWGHELSAFTHDLDSIAWALNHLPEKAPNAIQFRNLCRNAPAPERMPMVENSGPTRGPTEYERAQIANLRDLFRTPMRPSRDWARKLIDRHNSGEWISTSVALGMADEALRSHLVAEEFEA